MPNWIRPRKPAQPTPAPEKPKGVYLPYRNEAGVKALFGPMTAAQKLLDAPAEMLIVAVNNQQRLDVDAYKAAWETALAGLAGKRDELLAAIAELGTEEPQS